MEQQLADGQAELKQVKQQLREVKGQREELEDVVVTAQKKISRIGDEKHHLEQVTVDVILCSDARLYSFHCSALVMSVTRMLGIMQCCTKMC